jgi:hypothetical protein
MDDIIISTSQSHDTAKRAFDILNQKAIRSNFCLNEAKTNEPGESVTAFNIELSVDKIQLTNERLEEFKIAHNESANKFVREGIISYINSVSPVQAEQLAES